MILPLVWTLKESIFGFSCLKKIVYLAFIVSQNQPKSPKIYEAKSFH